MFSWKIPHVAIRSGFYTLDFYKRQFFGEIPEISRGETPSGRIVVVQSASYINEILRGDIINFKFN